MVQFESGLVLKCVLTKKVSLNEATPTSFFYVDAPDGTKWLDISVIKSDAICGPMEKPEALTRIGYETLQDLDDDGKLIIKSALSKVSVDGVIQGAAKWSMDLLVQVKRFEKAL